MDKLAYQVALYLIAAGLVLTGLSLLVYEIRTSVRISPQFAPVASTVMMISAMSLIARAHRD